MSESIGTFGKKLPAVNTLASDSEISQKVKAWSRCQSQITEVEFYWVIEKFSHKPQKAGQDIKSPFFNDGSNQLWSLQIFPRGLRTTDIGFISLYLVLEKPKTASIMVSYKLTLMNSKRKTIAVNGPHSMEFSTSVICRGEEKFVSLQDLYRERNNFFPDDELHIKCELSYQIKETTISGSSLFNSLPQVGTWIEHYQQLMESKSLSDVTIDVNGQIFESHKLVLSARSPVFNAMFITDLTERKTNTLEIQDIEPDVFIEVLRFIYTDEVKNMDELAPELLAAADKYMLVLLKSKCEASLARNITVENCSELLILAHLHSAENLKKILLDFVRCHSPEVAEKASWQKLIESAHPQLLRDISTALMTTHPLSIKARK